MEIITWGCQPNLRVRLYSESYTELRNSLFDLDGMSRQKGYVTVDNLYKKFGHSCPCSGYSNLGWYGPTCFGNGPIGEKKRLYDDKTVYYYDFPTTEDLTDYAAIVFHTNVSAPGYDGKVKIEFKEAIPKASKDAMIQKAYNVLTAAIIDEDADTCDLENAMIEASKYLGEVLE